MKQLQFCLIAIIFFTSHFIFAQDEATVEKEIIELHKPSQKIQDSIVKLQKECNLRIEAEKDSIKRYQLVLRLDSLENTKDQNAINQLKLDFDFARKHPNSMSALRLIRVSVGRFVGMNFYDTFVEVYQNFSPEIKTSQEGKEMAEKLKYFNQSKVGSIAPKFTLIDMNGKTVSLDDFKGKYVLIDFWASWCGPCREELPYIKELYKKYHNQGFEIISVAKDDKTESWKKAIVNENIESWNHLFATKDNSTIITDYFVNGIPHKLLIDKNGLIIGKWKGSGEINKHDLQKLIKTIFEAE
ncbi:TlpA family protein disulfide reductase [Flavobacterium sp. LAR06]|uniref:TlpA family protein disulfide reductase n=1 Tax=Flavobacterium sp. LAR06 TaxID=3064897 RepID=UPI0035BFD09D